MTDWIRNRKYYPIAEAADALKCKPMDLIHLGANDELHLCALATGWKWHRTPTNDELDGVERTPSTRGVALPLLPLEGPVELPPWTLLCIEATGRAGVDCVRVDECLIRLDEAQEVSPPQVFIMRTELDRLRTSGAEQIGNQEKASPKETNNLHCIIGAILKLMLSKTGGGRPGSVYDTQSAIIDALLADHPGRPGLSKRQLEKVFAEGKRLLAS
jgi:hypothetical protein